MFRCFKGTSQLSVEILCTHNKSSDNHVIAYGTSSDFLKGNLPARKIIPLSKAKNGAQAGSITVLFKVDQDLRLSRWSSEIRGAFNDRRLPASSYAGIKLLEGDVLEKIVPPSWAVVMTSLGRIVEAATPLLEVKIFSPTCFPILR